MMNIYYDREADILTLTYNGMNLKGRSVANGTWIHTFLDENDVLVYEILKPRVNMSKFYAVCKVPVSEMAYLVREIKDYLRGGNA